jgi:CBS domain containing-hemolysin-like protein
MELLPLALTLGGLVLLSGFFSGSETALFSIAPLRLREMSRSGNARERAVARAMERPRDTLVTILVGNMVVNILASALGTVAAVGMLGAGAGVAVATTVMTLLILVGGEIAPKTVAYRHAEPIARVVARPLLLLGRLLTPVRKPLLLLTDAVLGGEHRPDDRVDLEEVEAMLRMAHAEGEVETHERDLVRGVLELGSSPLEGVMTPRTEIFSLPSETPVADARGRVRESGFSKVPVASEEPDEMKGFVTARDLLLARADATLGAIARPVRYVPEVKPALELLDEFRESGARLAMVVDEHGHLAGLVTLTDLLEEVSGEMVEHGDLHKVAYRKTGPRHVAIPGRMEIRFFNEEFGTELEAEDAETMAGLLLERTGRIPAVGEEFTVDGAGFRVLERKPNRIVSLEITVPPRDGGAS